MYKYILYKINSDEKVVQFEKFQTKVRIGFTTALSRQKFRSYYFGYFVE